MWVDYLYTDLRVSMYYENNVRFNNRILGKDTSLVKTWSSAEIRKSQDRCFDLRYNDLRNKDMHRSIWFVWFVLNRYWIDYSGRMWWRSKYKDNDAVEMITLLKRIPLMDWSGSVMNDTSWRERRRTESRFDGVKRSEMTSTDKYRGMMIVFLSSEDRQYRS